MELKHNGVTRGWPVSSNPVRGAVMHKDRQRTRQSVGVSRRGGGGGRAVRKKDNAPAAKTNEQRRPTSQEDADFPGGRGIQQVDARGGRTEW